jgi:YebC/PmpR family DNA-binding regulatory protein
MSGHSKWAQIKRKKAVSDVKKGKEFSRLARALQLAAQKGADPAMNAPLRLAVEKARAANMPNVNIDRAIAKGAGMAGGAALEESLYEAYGPGGAALLIETITDNRNRTVAELKHLLQKQGGVFAEAGAVRWMFRNTFVVRVPASISQDAVEGAALAGGADDVVQEDDTWALIAPLEQSATVQEECRQRGWEIREAAREWRPAHRLEIPADAEQSLEALLQALSEHDDVQEVYTNMG